MSHRTFARALLIAIGLVWTRNADASPGYCPVLDSYLGVNCWQGSNCCLLCHTDPSGASGTPAQPLSTALRAVGLTGAENDQSLRSSLAQLDGDGGTDIADLRACRDPNAAPGDAGSEAGAKDGGGAPATAHGGCACNMLPGALGAGGLLGAAAVLLPLVGVIGRRRLRSRL
jgi:hypothetical protein